MWVCVCVTHAHTHALPHTHTQEILIMNFNSFKKTKHESLLKFAMQLHSFLISLRLFVNLMVTVVLIIQGSVMRMSRDIREACSNFPSTTVITYSPRIYYSYSESDSSDYHVSFSSEEEEE